MNFDLTDEQQMLRDAAQRFAEEHYSFEARREILASPEGFSRTQWESYAEMGWLALGLPEDVGGLGCSFVETALLMEEFGRVLALEPYISSAIVCARILERSQHPAQRAAQLSSFIEGKNLMALAYSEGGSRYSREAARCVAVAQGDHYVVSGIKTMVYDAPAADHFIVTASISGSQGLFLIPAAHEGVRVSQYRLIDGTHAGDVEFRDVRLPNPALLVGTASATDVLEEALDRAVLAQIAESLGAMNAVLAITSDYLKQRVQFGRPIGTFQALQHRMSEMFVEAQQTRSMLYRGLAYLDAAASQRVAAVSAAKVVAGNAAAFVGVQGIQLHGGIGLTQEYAVGHYYKKLVLFGKRYGDVDFHTNRFMQMQSE